MPQHYLYLMFCIRSINIYLSTIKYLHFTYKELFKCVPFINLFSSLPVNFKKAPFVWIYSFHWLNFSYFFKINNFIFYTLSVWFYFFFIVKSFKVKFFGKGYRTYLLKRNTLTFNFGYSHLYFLYYFQTIPILLSKFKLVFFGLNYFILRNDVFQFVYTRYYNLFTSKGVRFIKQYIRKKVGKVSLYF